MSESQKIWLVHIFFDIPVLLICAGIMWSHRDVFKKKPKGRPTINPEERLSR
jgi:hypothetical protein